MYERHSDTRLGGLVAAMVRYELDRRYCEAERLRLVAQASAARPTTPPALSLLRRWAHTGVWVRG